ncbi:MAG: T9SS type A sorting domain-containing protein [Bacteroidales bacterium]|nr:T9SS type A sorting domain-containing protein [Bacteroidales bacterium]
MKKIVLITAFILLCLQGRSQQEYDTIIYYPPTVLNCPMWMDSVNLNNPADPSVYYQIFQYYSEMRRTCYGNLPLIPSVAYVIGASDTIYVKNVAFAQPYHLDSTVLVIGVAAKVYGHKSSMGGYNYFRLMDSSKTEIAYVHIPVSNPHSYYQIQQGKYYFNNQVMLKDFYIAADVGNGHEDCTYEFDHTCTFTDDSCLKIDVGCYEDEYPYLLKRNATQWTRFDQDTVYYYYRKMHIGFFPIILVPRPDSLSLGNEIDINNTCNILPNPARDIIKLISQFKVNDIEIYNISGIKLKTITINAYEKYIDISDLKKGAYIITINTPRGIATKKLLVE